jgi:plastocyanin
MSVSWFTRKRPLQLALLALGLLGVLAIGAACGGNDDNGGTATPGTATTTAPSNGDDDDNGNGASDEPITIDMRDNVFEPNEIRVPVNTEVEITVENKGLAVHNMHVLSKDKEGQDFISDALVSPGKSSTFKVIFKNKGTVDFQCDYHLPEMVGKIIVE